MSHPAPNSPLPEPGHCACKFSSGGVLSKECAFHKGIHDLHERELSAVQTRLEAAERRAEARAREACTFEKRATCSFASSASSEREAHDVFAGQKFDCNYSGNWTICDKPDCVANEFCKRRSSDPLKFDSHPIAPPAMGTPSVIDQDARWQEIQRLSHAAANKDDAPTETESALCGAVLRAQQLERELSAANDRLNAKAPSVDAIEAELVAPNGDDLYPPAICNMVTRLGDLARDLSRRLAEAQEELETNQTTTHCIKVLCEKAELRAEAAESNLASERALRGRLEADRMNYAPERVAEAVAAERERCAKIKPQHFRTADLAPSPDWRGGYNLACEQYEAAIRGSSEGGKHE